MGFLAAALGLVLLHFVIYATVVRRVDRMRSESGILYFHLGSFAALTCAGVLYMSVVPQADAVAAVGAALALHGIYSLTFLEIWSVVEGSFVFWTLSRIDKGGDELGGLAELEAVGATKRASRIRNLVALGLIERGDAGLFTLSRRGRIVACIVGLLVWLTNAKHE